jgi:hypothetical protein
MTLRERSARLYTGNHPLVVRSIGGKKGSTLFSRSG